MQRSKGCFLRRNAFAATLTIGATLALAGCATISGAAPTTTPSASITATPTLTPPAPTPTVDVSTLDCTNLPSALPSFTSARAEVLHGQTIIICIPDHEIERERPPQLIVLEAPWDELLPVDGVALPVRRDLDAINALCETAPEFHTFIYDTGQWFRARSVACTSLTE